MMAGANALKINCDESFGCTSMTRDAAARCMKQLHDAWLTSMTQDATARRMSHLHDELRTCMTHTMEHDAPVWYMPHLYDTWRTCRRTTHLQNAWPIRMTHDPSEWHTTHLHEVWGTTHLYDAVQERGHLAEHDREALRPLHGGELRLVVGRRSVKGGSQMGGTVGGELGSVRARWEEGVSGSHSTSQSKGRTQRKVRAWMKGREVKW